MADQLQYDFTSLDGSSKRMEAAAQDLATKTSSLMGEVSDATVLGTNDTLGSIASMLYSLAVQAVQESVDSVQEEYGVQGDKIASARAAFAAAEEGFAEAGAKMVGDE